MLDRSPTNPRGHGSANARGAGANSMRRRPRRQPKAPARQAPPRFQSSTGGAPGPGTFPYRPEAAPPTAQELGLHLPSVGQRSLPALEAISEGAGGGGGV